ncbi:MAG: hypothetical protein IT452_17480 [Planctomycetia bacterium]|nr:hypothetical protein [Planctomycetia bacterium]
MKRRGVFACAALAAAALGFLLFLGWTRGVSGTDPLGKLPRDLEAVVRVRSLPALAGPLGRLSGRDVRALEGWAGPFGAAAAGVRGRDAVVVRECPRLARFGPVEEAAADALGLAVGPQGGRQLAGRPVWLEARGSWLWIATSRELLQSALRHAADETPLPADCPDLEIADRGLLSRLDADRDAGRLDDAARLLHGAVRGALEPGITVRGRVAGDSLVLRGHASWTLETREVAKRAAASAPAAPFRVSSWSIPGLAASHATRFNSRAVWDEIFHDPANARFVDAFQKEIAEYEEFLGGRRFTTDLLPKLGPERAWAVARIDPALYRIQPRTPVPAVLFAVHVRGIEAEALKSLDKFLTEAEAEGKKMDLPAPKGRTSPVLEPFHHDKVMLEGREIWRVLFREGVSEFGPEFAPGYTVVDGTLWISSFWPLLAKIAPLPAPAEPFHARGAVVGPAALALARDAAGEFAEMQATWAVLDRVAPDAAGDFAAAFGSTRTPTESYLRAFTDLETGLLRERPDLRGREFDRELEDRLKAWEAGELRAFAAKRAEEKKREPAFRADVDAKRGRIDRVLDSLKGLGSVEWRLERELVGNRETDRWELRIVPAP